MERTLSLTVLAVLGLTSAATAASLPPIRVEPLRRVPAAATAAAATAADPHAVAIGARLRAVLAGRDAAAVERRSQAQRTALAALRAEVGDGLEVHLRPGVGTPIQIRIRGRALQRARRGLAGPDHEATAREFLNRQRALLRLDQPEDELALARHELDGLGRRHLRFAQRYRGLPVWPADLVVHLDAGGDVDLVNGAFVPTPSGIAPQPAIDAATAIARGRAGVPEAAGGRAATPELIVYAPGDRPSRLAWRFTLAVSLASRWMVIVDARDGRVLAAFDEVPDANVAGSGVDLLGRTRPLNVFVDDGLHFLADTSKPMFDPTSSPPDWATARGEILILDARNQPPNSRPEELPDLFFVTAPSPTSFTVADGVSAAFGLSEVYDYYLERHGRDSLDGQGGNILAIVRLGRNFFNAFWSGTFIAFGDAEPFAASLDVVAHELTHGVTDYTAQLVYMDQSGALNEAFSDIFGESVEAYSQGGGPDWLLGSDLSQPLRDMADPGRFGDPALFSDFVVTELDNGGVHTNSGIINRAYYLLAEGMPGALGVGDAERIFYRALAVHLVSRSQFVDARLACIAAAAELFGPNSTQARQTAAAFDAVEVVAGTGTPPPTPFPGVSGDDAVLFVFDSPDLDAPSLGRRETGLGDGANGVQLIDSAVAAARPSVSGDGSFAAYVGADNDICLLNTDGSPLDETTGSPALCLGFPGFVYAAAVAPDGERFGFVLQDDDGNPLNTITVIDTSGEPETTTYELRAPANDGAQIDTIAFAESMDFTAGGDHLVYEALNLLQLGDGSRVEAYSIYALDLASGESQIVIPPVPPLDVGNPALAQRSDDFLVFEIIDYEQGVSTVAAASLLTGELTPVAEDDDFTVPSYSGDDAAIIYSQNGTIRRQPVAADRMTPQGDATTLLPDAQLAVIYRRGPWVGPGACAGDCNGDGTVTIDEVVRGVGMALGTIAATACPVFDADGGGSVTVDELVRAVNAGLSGCAS